MVSRFSFAFSGDNHGFIGGDKYYAGKGFLSSDYYNFMFQWAFASTAATIVSGGVAERIRLSSYTAFSIFMSFWIYPIVVHWVWSDEGWLKKMDFIDFAGSGVVHLTGGTSALVGALLLGHRNGRYDPQKESEFIPNNMSFTVLGTFILWMGWYGFNCGSTLVADIEKIGLIGMNTTLAGVSGGVFVYSLHYLFNRNTNNKYSIPALCNGIVAGLVSVTAGCANFETYCAFFIGMIGGAVYFISSRLFARLKIDDPLDASSIHGACGFFGIIAVAFFDIDHGIYYLHEGRILGVQLLGAITIFAWSFGWTFLFFGILKIIGRLRIDKQEEFIGSDLTKHGQYGIIMDLSKLRMDNSDNAEKMIEIIKKTNTGQIETDNRLNTEQIISENNNQNYEMVVNPSKENMI